MSERYKFFQHRDCEHFPCHPEADPETFNCLFCCCPLYPLKENCGGAFTYTETGVKDCTHCLYPHRPEHYDEICCRLSEVIDLCRR